MIFFNSSYTSTMWCKTSEWTCFLSSAFLFVNGKLSWQHFHLMISRSTTPDLIKIVSKLDEFFSQQVMSGRRVFQPSGGQSKAPRKISESGEFLSA